MKFPEPRLESRNPSRNLPFARETCHYILIHAGQNKGSVACAPDTAHRTERPRPLLSFGLACNGGGSLSPRHPVGWRPFQVGRRDGRTTSKTLSGSQLSELHMMENRWKRYEKPLKTMWWFHVRSQLKDCSRIPKRASLTLTATQRPDGSG